MQFVYPTFLFALTAIAIPIIIHLFHFRRYKKIIFSDIRFLKKVEEETRSRQRLRELLILLARVLSIIFLVLAFAQPFLPLSKNPQEVAGLKVISIFLDNSFSMGAEGSEGILLEEAKSKARAIIQAYGTADLFQVINHDFEGAGQRLLNKTDAIRLVDEAKLTGTSRLPGEIKSRQNQALENAGGAKKIFYYISDFQKSAAWNSLPHDSSAQTILVPVQSKDLHNLFIDSAWLASPVVRANEPVNIKFRVRNSGKEGVENIPVSLTVNGNQKGLQNISCAPNDYTNSELSFSPTSAGNLQCVLSLIDHPVTFDDKLYFTLTTAPASRITAINGNEPSTFISTVFKDDPAFVFTNADISRLNYSAFKEQQCIILNAAPGISSGLITELGKFVKDGGFLILIPSPNPAEALLLNPLLSGFGMPLVQKQIIQERKVEKLNLGDEMLRDVFVKVPRNMDMPAVHKFYEMQRTSSTAGTSLMTLNDGSVFMHGASVSKGKVILFAAPLISEWSNLQQHALFVPIMLKAAFGTRKSYTLYYQFGKDQWIETSPDFSGSEKIIRVQGNGSDVLANLQQKNGRNMIRLEGDIRTAGHYMLSLKGGTSPGNSSFAINYPRIESTVETMGSDELDKVATGVGTEVNYDDTIVMQQKIKQELNGTQFWRICLILALVFVLIEILLLKLLK